jgi:hypothetical protein
MRAIPQSVRKEISKDPRYTICSLMGVKGHVCGGRITMEHALIYRGRQIQEKWAIIPVCAAGQEVDEYQDAHTMDKEMNQWVAFNQATDEDLMRYPRAYFFRDRERLNNKYGPYTFPIVSPFSESGINYSFLHS